MNEYKLQCSVLKICMLYYWFLGRDESGGSVSPVGAGWRPQSEAYVNGGVGVELQAFSWEKDVSAQAPQCYYHLQASRFWQDCQYVCTG